MLILGDLSAEVPDTNAYHWNLEEHSDVENKEQVFMYGFNASGNRALQEACQEFDRKVYFNNWIPCEFAQRRTTEFDAFKKEGWFDEVYSICPYSNKWLNELGVDREYKDIFYPFHKRLIPESLDKEYDVIYHGGIHGQEHIDCLRVMLNYKYRFCSMSSYINQTTAQRLGYATNINLTFQEKINLIAKTKISVCYNLVHINPDHIPAIKSYDDWQKNEAFSEVDGWNVMPQFKTRMHEAAISKTLNLIMRDKWNIAERYYAPDKEFIYFDDADDLNQKIADITADWKNYEHIVENAYNRAMEYTTDKFVETIKEG